MLTSSEIIYDRRGSAAWLRLNRPAKRNALTPESVRGLCEGLAEAELDAGVRSLVITGEGSAFCAGADLDYFLGCVAAPEGCDRFFAEMLLPLQRLLAAVRASRLPVLCAVNGPVAAGGLEIVVGCDLIVASATATFTDAHSRRGIAPAVGGAFGLAAAVGAQRAARMLLLSDSYDARTMVEYGLVAEAVEPDRLADRVDEITAALAERSPRSLVQMKRMLQRAQTPDWAQQIEMDLDDFRDAWGNPDMAEGIAAYVERRSAVFA